MKKIFLTILFLLVTSSAFAYTPYNTDMKIARCEVNDRFEAGHPTIYAYNRDGVLLNQFGDNDGGRFENFNDAIFALDKLVNHGICPSGHTVIMRQQ
jgi:hypothetical protein